MDAWLDGLFKSSRLKVKYYISKNFEKTINMFF